MNPKTIVKYAKSLKIKTPTKYRHYTVHETKSSNKLNINYIYRFIQVI
jgi:hypothetical protein